MISVSQPFVDEPWDVPVGLGRDRFPRSGAPIEVGQPDDLLVGLDQPRNCRRLPDVVQISVRIGEDALWEGTRMAPQVFLSDLACKWRLLMMDPSPAIEISTGTSSSFTPAIVLRREGVESRLSISLGSVTKLFRVPFNSALETLEEFGHAIAIRLPPECEAVRAWRDRLPRDRAGLAALDAELLDLPPSVTSTFGFEPVNDVHDLAWPGDVRIAARLAYTPEIDVVTLRKALDVIRAHEPVETEELDRLASEAMSALSSKLNGGLPPYEKGHELALWVRGRLGLPNARVDIEQMLLGWSVTVTDLDLATQSIDAIAAWGDYGPVIVVNKSGRRSSSPAGRRATLAHELCHLLIDRSGALPVAEAQGLKVRTTPDIESRANAFGVELLLPREEAGRVLRQTGSVSESVNHLVERFDVSRTLALRQLANHPANAGAPTVEQRAEIKRLISESERIS